MRTPRLARRHRWLAPLLCLFALALSLALVACNGGTSTAPLPGPQPETGAVLGGTVRNLGGQGVGGVVVMAEPVVDGVAASVRARLDSQARGGDAAVAAADPADAAKAAGARHAAVTDDAGRFALAGLEPGQWLLTTEARDHQAGRATVTVPDLRAAALAETTFVDISLVPTGTFRGSVTLQNAANHQSTVVYCEGTSYVAVTNAQGDFAMSDVPAGAYTLQATHSGWLDQATNGTLTSAGETVELAPLVLLRESNMPPVATISAPTAGTNVPQSLTVFGGAASDPDGTIVLYEWDFDGDGTFDTSSTTSANTTHVWPVTGTFRSKLRVTDDAGAIGLAVVTFTVMEEIHVSAATGSDINPGTKAAPVATITRGLDLAVATGMPLVRVAAATYNENVLLRDDVSITGGFMLPGWTRNSGDYSTIEAIAPAFRQAGVAKATYTGLVFQAPTATGPGLPSIGLWLDGCDDLEFVDCSFVSGDGSTGNTGTTGNAGTTGGGGGFGLDGSTNSCWVAGGGTNGTGSGTVGNGGSGGDCEGNGATGAAGSGGVPGGAGGAFATSCAANGGPGGNGTNGTTGAFGANGSGGVSTVGGVSGGGWVAATANPGLTGATGGIGGGGGGGGGSYNQIPLCSGDGGGGGGGGGAGGSSGQGGGGGQGGGASIAVLLFDSSPTFDADCRFQSGRGGQGGVGGQGGSGGAGGARGAGGSGGGSGKAGFGGFGGFGGAGGGGGGGQGGPGGPSICLYRAGISAPVIIGSPTMTVGLPGSGGVGGLRGGGGSSAPTGPTGTAQAIYP
jgi:hypothetical protein